MVTLRKIIRWTGYLALLSTVIFIAFLVIPEKETVRPIVPRPDTRYWTMSNGFRIAYTEITGEGDTLLPPVVFLHGGPGGYVHSSTISTLGQVARTGRTIYFYDQRGSGLSDRLPKFSDVSFELHLQDLHEIIDRHLRAKKVVLIGQSFGCVLIAHYSARYPERIEKIVLGSPGTLLPYRQEDGRYVDLDSLFPAPDSLQFSAPYDFVDEVNRTALKPKAIVAALGALLLDKKLVSDTQMDRMLNTLATKFTKGMVCDPQNVLPEEGGGGLYAYLATNNDELPEVRPAMSQYQSPVLVMQGQCEYHSYATAREYVDLYPAAEYRFIEEAGHEIWWEQPAAYLGAILQFLAR